MLKYFDSVYYRIRDWYSNMEGQKAIASESSVLLLCVYQTVILLSLISLVNIFFTDFPLKKLHIIFFCIGLGTLNFIRYTESKYQELHLFFKNETLKERKFKRLKLTIIMSFSLVFFVLLTFIKSKLMQ